MNSKSLTKVFIFILTLFIAEIVSTIAKNYLNIHPGYKDPFTLTAIKMGIILLIYYPVFKLLSGLSEILSKHFFKKTKTVLVGGIPGLIIAFLIGLAICYFIFLKLWYHINVFEVMWAKL
jgi:hypothetical protein